MLIRQKIVPQYTKETSWKQKEQIKYYTFIKLEPVTPGIRSLPTVAKGQNKPNNNNNNNSLNTVVWINFFYLTTFQSSVFFKLPVFCMLRILYEEHSDLFNTKNIFNEGGSL